MPDDDTAAMRRYYARDRERDRLAQGVGRVEFARTVEVVSRTLPPAPARVADIGGGPGRYTDWLVELGYTVIHRDIVEHHVDQVQARHGADVDTAVGDARDLDLADASVDVVLLLGPLYHLTTGPGRHQALTEAARVVRPGGIVHVAAISRWASRLHGILVDRIHHEHPVVLDKVDEMESTGWIPAVIEGGFTGFAHTPELLRDEITGSGLTLESLVALEGISFALGDLEQRLDEPDERALLLHTLRMTESIPDLVGLGTHLLASARRGE